MPNTSDLDADFLYGPPDDEGADTYVSCEMNISSVFAIPDQAAAPLGRCVARRLNDDALRKTAAFDRT